MKIETDNKSTLVFQCAVAVWMDANKYGDPKGSCRIWKDDIERRLIREQEWTWPIVEAALVVLKAQVDPTPRSYQGNVCWVIPKDKELTFVFTDR